MSNKTNQSVLVNDTSSYYLKQYAALQFPGSVDNFGTKTPIHLLQQQEESEHSVSLPKCGVKPLPSVMGSMSRHRLRFG